MISVLIKKKKKKTQQGKGCVKMDAEVEVRLPQTNECQRLPATIRRRESWNEQIPLLNLHTDPADILISDLSLPELGEEKFLWL